MFKIDRWQEIFSTIKKNKLRTFLTSFSVAWGILMLIILLGSGKGLQNASLQFFEEDAKNAIHFWGGVTSISEDGLSAGRRISLTDKDYEVITQEVEGIEHSTPSFQIYQSSELAYKNHTGNFNIKCVYPDNKYIEITPIISGRFLNEKDVDDYRKVMVIGDEVQKALFKGEDPIGEYIKLNNVLFKVVGVFKKSSSYDNREVFIPFNVAQSIYGGGTTVHSISVTTGDATVAQNKAIEQKILAKLSALHNFNKDDPSAIYMWNTLESYDQTTKIFKGINIFIWFIGIGTLIAGIVGVSNIMMIVVKERTREIGVRKALGASPNSIINLIVSEAIFITTLAGYIGMVLGIAIMKTVDYFIDKQLAEKVMDGGDMDQNFAMFINPNVDLKIAIGATILLIISGALAGFIPARKAAKIKPIEALRYE